MLTTALKVAALSVLTLQTTAKTIQISVGQGGTSFTPDTITADDGDILEYHFVGGQHSVVMADYDNGCTPATSGGFFSGFQKSPRGFRVEVNGTDPIFFYCSASKHCQGGMVGVVNPSSSQTLGQFRNNAKASRSNISPPASFGGELY